MAACSSAVEGWDVVVGDFDGYVHPVEFGLGEEAGAAVVDRVGGVEVG